MPPSLQNLPTINSEQRLQQRIIDMEQERAKDEERGRAPNLPAPWDAPAPQIPGLAQRPNGVPAA